METKENMSKHERIELRKKHIGSKHERKLKKYSNGFNEMFNFFLKSYRTDLLSFCGSEIKVKHNINGFDGKECFRRFEDGFFKNKSYIETRHPNIVLGVITGKKGWGLWKNEWCQGIAEGNFLRSEILNEFNDRKIIIPISLFDDFENTLFKIGLEQIKGLEQKKINSKV